MVDLGSFRTHLFSVNLAFSYRVANAAFGYPYLLSNLLNRHPLIQPLLDAPAFGFIQFIAATMAAFVDQQSRRTALFISQLVPADRRTIHPQRSGQLGRLDRLDRTKHSLRQSQAVLVIFRTLENSTRGVQKYDFSCVVKNSQVIVDRFGTFGKQRYRHLQHVMFSDICCIPIYDNF